jgi:hypothetical protein
MFDTFTDTEVLALHNAYKAARASGRRVMEWTSGDTSSRVEFTIDLDRDGPMISLEFRRRFPDECRPRYTRTRAVFS